MVSSTLCITANRMQKRRIVPCGKTSHAVIAVLLSTEVLEMPNPIKLFPSMWGQGCSVGARITPLGAYHGYQC